MQSARRPFHPARHLRLLAGAGAVALLSACAQEAGVDFDLRSFADGFSTADAARNAAARPAPDSRGVITYPNTQVVVASRGDTVRSIAGRLGLNADEVARFNGIAPDAELRRDEIIALPSRVAVGNSAAPVAAPAAGGGALDVTTIASAALDRAGNVTAAPLPAAAGAAAPAQPARDVPFGTASPEPVRHQVGRGETAYTIARLYNVPVRDIAAWNGLGPDLAVREGQQLLVPLVGGTPPAAATPAAATATPAPGAGSPTPVPPSAAAPLPDDTPPPAADPAPAAAAPDLGASQTPAPDNARLQQPVPGSIIRAFAAGRYDGIDIGAPAGTDVRAADAGTVAAITTNTEGVQIVVIRHADNLLTVYTHLDNLTVAKDATVSRGQVIGKVRAGSPSFLHFQVRRGMQSLDPAEFLP